MRIGNRRFAGEVFADVGRWAIIHPFHPTQGLQLFLKVTLALSAIGQEKDLVRNEMAMNLLQERAGSVGVTITRKHNLARRTQAQLERHEHLRHGAGEMTDLRRERVDRFLGAFVIACVVPDLGEPKKVQRGHGTGGRLRAVVVLFQTKQNARILSGAVEVTAAHLIEK